MSAPRLLAPTTISGGVPTAGAGTLNTIALWTPDGNTLGNSLLTQSGNIVTNASGAIRALGTTQTSPAFTRHDTTTSGIYFPATNEIGFTISNQHAMFISSGRNVGIGTTSPGFKLDVVTTEARIGAPTPGTNTFLYLGNGVTSAGPYGIGALQYSGQAHTALFANSAYGAARASLGMVSAGVYTPALSADPSGNVGIGTASPLAKVHSVIADGVTYSYGASGTTKGFRVEHSAAETRIVGVDNTLNASYQPLVLGGSTLGFNTGGTTRALTIDATQQVGIGTASPTDSGGWSAGRILDVRSGSVGTSAVIYVGDSGRATNTQLGFYGSGYGFVGTVTNHSFQILQNNGAALVVDTSKNVGIGTASPLSIAGVGLTVYGATNGAFYLQNSSNNSRVVSNGNDVYIDAGAGGTGGAVVFRRSSSVTESARIDSSGNIILNSATTNAVIQASGTGQGLKLPATPGNADTQTLDCYAEGTWTPTLTGFGGTTPTVTSARYTRVGRTVLLEVSINATGGATYSGTRAATYLSLPAGMVPPTISAAGAMTDSGINTLGTAVAYYNGNLYLPTFAATAVNTFVTVSYSI